MASTEVQTINPQAGMLAIVRRRRGIITEVREFDGDNGRYHLVRVDYKDDATAFNGEKKGTIAGKGVINNRMTNFMFKMLEKEGVPTHLVEEISDRETIVKKVSIVPLEVIIRNVAAGSFSKRMGVEEGKQLLCPILEYSYKNDALGDPMVSEEYILAFGWASQQDMDDIVSLALRVNDFLSGVFFGVGIKLVDFKIECGRLYENDTMRIVLADEISPDNCRLWDIKTRNKLDKDRFREDLGGLVDAYREVAQRLGILVETDNALTTGPRLVQ